MLIFIDSEFTGLGQRFPRLISIALVPADGRDTFYAELPEDGWKEKASSWVLDNVVPLLDGGDAVLSPEQLRERMLAWFAARPRTCQIAADSETDFKFLTSILENCWPENLDRKFFDLRGMFETPVFNLAVEDYFSPVLNRKPHHALHDARANRQGWLAYCDSRKDEA